MDRDAEPVAPADVGVALLRRQLDAAERDAAQLLELLPPPSLEPGKGRRFDGYA